MTTVEKRSTVTRALVLGSGGARAAYEVGVARYLFEDLAEELGRSTLPPILCGCSAGALNVLGLAAFAQRPMSAVALLAHRWEQLQLEDFLRPRHLELLGLVGALLGCPAGAGQALGLRGAIFDARPLRAHVLAGLPDRAIASQLEAGRLEAVSFTATEVATGRSVYFVESRAGRRHTPAVSGATQFVPVEIGAHHALASAAIPLLFPPVRWRGRLYCDGSLRQSVPFSAALHLGADRVIAVSTQPLAPRVAPPLAAEREQALANPLYLLGKAVNALTLDRVDDELERLALINEVLEAGTKAFGPEFLATLNRELGGTAHRTVRPIRAAIVRPSESVGRMAAEYVRGPNFKRRNRGVVGRFFGRLADAEAPHEADLLSYLLFDGPFTSSLMDLGYADARAQHEQLRAIFSDDVAQTQAA